MNAPAEAYARAIDDLGAFKRRWPDAVAAVISGRHPLEAAPDLLRERGSGIKQVIAIT